MSNTEMYKISMFFVLLTLLNSNIVLATSSENSAAEESGGSSEYLSINVDRVVIDTAGLAAASTRLADSVDRLATAIGKLSADNVDLTDEEKQILIGAVKSAQEASTALTELSSGLLLAGDSLRTITESLPQATENAKQLVDVILDSALQKLTIYTILLVAIVALALIGIMWFIYRQYLNPLIRKLDELVGAPEHFDNMALHMRETSDNLLALQDIDTRKRRPNARRYRRKRY